MTLTRVVVAWCDEEGCTVSTALDPQDSQPWLTLTDRGWTLDHEAEEPLTYCPDHDKNRGGLHV